MTNIAVLGGGRMGEALCVGLRDSGMDPECLVIAEVDPDRRRALEDALPNVRIAPNPAWVVGDADVVVVAVKPADVANVFESATPALPEHSLVLSIAAGVTIDQLEEYAPKRPVVRAMPNTPALVRRGAAAIAGGAHATESDLELAERILGAVGTVVRVPEKLLDTVTGLSGSGPAYVFLLVEALIDAGVLHGLPRDVATTLVNHTVFGAGAMLVEGDDDATKLRAAVTSPGGTTAAGLRALEDHAFRAAVIAAVTAATERSRALGQAPSPASPSVPPPEEPASPPTVGS